MHRAFSVLILCIFWGWSIAVAAPSSAQRKEAKELEVALTKAGNLYKDNKHEEAGEVIREVQSRLEKFVADGGTEVLPLAESLHARLVRAHALLELQGIELPELKKFTPPAETRGSSAGASFSKDVAPILLTRCGRCHVNDSKGEFSMSNYATLMRGPVAGVVVFPGDPQGSRLIEVIESGDMPRGGQKVPASELGTLKRWIQAGAKFDGEEPDLPLVSLARIPNTAGAARKQVTTPTGKESVHFAQDIASILVDNCSGCHVNSMRVRANLNMSTFRGLMRGGDSGPPVVPGKPDESLLLQKLLGKGGGERMPQGRPPLSSDWITKIETWIKEGAAYDGGDTNLAISDVAAIAKAKGASHEELSAERRKLAQSNWQLGMPGVEPKMVESEHFLVLGDFGEATLSEYSKTAESVVPKVAGLLKVPHNKPLIKGRMSLFFLSDRYSYSEFGKMVEERDIPKEYRGHWRFNVVDAYGALVPPKSDEYSLSGLVAQQLAATYVASLGKSPRWFSEGAGRALAARIVSGDPRVANWEQQLPGVIASMAKPDDFIAGRMPPENSDIASFSFVRYLMRDAKRFDAVLDGIQGGQDFETAFGKGYGATPVQFIGTWVQQAAKVKPVKRSGKRATS